MDLRLFFGVISRFRWLVGAGTCLAAILGVLAYGTPNFSHGIPSLTPRGSEVWQAEAELMITRASNASAAAHNGPSGTGASTTPEALASLAPIYATVANGDAVQAQIRETARVAGTVHAAEVVDIGASRTLPFVTLTSSAPTRGDARILAERASAILRDYVFAEQMKSGTSTFEHVQLQAIKGGSLAKLAEGHKLTVPLLVFVGVLVAVLTLVFTLENLRPQTAVRLRRVPGKPVASTEHQEHSGRRTVQSDSASVVAAPRRVGTGVSAAPQYAPGEPNV